MTRKGMIRRKTKQSANQRVGSPTYIVLPNPTNAQHGLNGFGIYAPQSNTS